VKRLNVVANNEARTGEIQQEKPPEHELPEIRVQKNGSNTEKSQSI